MINFTFGKRFKKWCIQLEAVIWYGQSRYDNMIAGIHLAIPFPTLLLCWPLKKLLTIVGFIPGKR